MCFKAKKIDGLSLQTHSDLKKLAVLKTIVPDFDIINIAQIDKELMEIANKAAEDHIKQLKHIQNLEPALPVFYNDDNIDEIDEESMEMATKDTLQYIKTLNM